MRLLIICTHIVIGILSASTCQLPLQFNCLNASQQCANATSISSMVGTIYDCPQTLLLTADTLDIAGTFSSLVLVGGNVTVGDLVSPSDLTVNVSQMLAITGRITLVGNLLINCNGSPASIENTFINASKIIMIGLSTLSISGSELNTFWNLCLYESINIINNSQLVEQFINASNLPALAKLNYSTILSGTEDIQLESSSISSVSIVILGGNGIALNSSLINSTARSCKTNFGPGRGAVVQFNNSYCTSGSSSCGFGVLSNFTLCENTVQYFLFLSHSFPYISKGPYLSTGSGGYGYNLNQDGRGAGGGIIFLYAGFYTLLEDSIIEARGGNVNAQDELSAGSGGTIFVTSKNITGVGKNVIAASGGNSSNNKGAGGGGLVKISFVNSTETPPGSLFINIYQGVQQNFPFDSIYSNGIFYGPLCKGGNQVNYITCISCNQTSYSTLGDPVCRSCPTSHVFVTNQDLVNKSLLSQCYSIKKEGELFTYFLPGQIDLLSIALYLASLVLFTFIGAILKRRIKKEKLSSGEEFKLEDVQKDIDKAKILALELRKSKDVKPYELMYHVHRISCFGSNSQNSPWVLPTTVPTEVRKYVLPQVYTRFAQNFNRHARWSKLQYWLTWLSSLVYPIYWFYLDNIKKKKYKKLNGLLQNSIDYNLINNYDYDDRSIITIKFSKNKDYTNCYLDFFVYERADLKYFSLGSPFILYLSGQGNFLRPFYLEEGDVFLRLMFFVVNRELIRSQDSSDEKKQLFNSMVSQKRKQKNNFQMNRFVRKLNTLACTLDLSAKNSQIVDSLWKLVQFIERWNREFFSKASAQLDLVIFMSRLLNKAIIDNQIQILTKRNKEQFRELILSKIDEIQSWEESSIKIGLLVYNPDQEIPRQDDKRISHVEEMERFSLEEIDDNLSRSLLVSQIRLKGKTLPKRMLSWVKKLIGLMRYFTMSHQNTKFDEYTIKFWQSFFILLQTMLVFIWSIKLQIPYPLVNLVMPFVGIIWFVSDSYGFGKLYLILNTMSMVNEVITLITYSSIQTVLLDRDGGMLILKNVICSAVNLSIIVFMMFIGNRAITQSKKLSLKKEDELQPLRFQ